MIQDEQVKTCESSVWDEWVSTENTPKSKGKIIPNGSRNLNPRRGKYSTQNGTERQQSWIAFYRWIIYKELL